MRILEEFWYGNIDPHEQSYDMQSRLGKIMSLLTQNESKLLERLNAEEKEIFEKYQDCHHEITQIVECEAFIKGFRLGGQIMLEVCENTDCPFIDEA